MRIVDITQLGEIDEFKVSIDGKETELQIGDQIIFPIGSPILKTIIAMTIFEDKSVNYTLKWFDGDSFKTENVSMTDLKIMCMNEVPQVQAGFAYEAEPEDEEADEPSKKLRRKKK